MKFLINLSVPLIFFLTGCGPLVPLATESAPTPEVNLYRDFAYDIVWSQDDSMVALTTQTGLYVYDVKTHEELFSFDQNGSYVVFGKQYMAFINWQGLFVYDLNGFKLLFNEKPTDGRMFQSLAISPNDQTLVAGEQDRLRAWSLPDGKLITTLTEEENEQQVFLRDIILKDDTHLVVADSYFGRVQEWDLVDRKLIHEFNLDKPVVYLRLSDNGELVLVDYGLTGFQLWDTTTGKIKENYGDIVSASGWQRLSRDNRYVVVWGYAFDGVNSGMSVWDLNIHLQIQEFTTAFVNGDGWRCGALNSDGSTLAASNNEGFVHFYEVKTGEKIGGIFLPYEFK